MPPSNKYQVIVEAIVDQAQLQQQFSKVQATLNQLAAGRKIVLFDDRVNHEAIQSAKREVEKLFGDVQAFGKVKIFESPSGEVTGAIVQYRDKLNLVQQAYLKIAESGGKWELASRSTAQNIDQARKEAEKFAKQQEQMYRSAYQMDQEYNLRKERMLREAYAQNEKLDRQKEIAIKRQELALDRLQIKNKDAFGDSAVKVALTNYNKMFDAFKSGKATLDQVKLAFGDLSNSVAKFNEATRSANKSGLSFTSMLDVAIKKIAVWGMGTMAIYGTMRKIQDGIQYIRDLNKELTNTQIVTGESSQKIGQLASKYNQLALELGATTLQVAQSSLTFIRQGKSAEESGILVRNSMMISKLANLESAQASEYLTSVMNGYQMSVEETTGAIDKMVAVDNAAATSVGELAEALSRTSSVAQTSGVSFENLVAYIGTVSSITRRNAESIGEAFKNFVMLMNMCYNRWRRWGIINNPQMKILFNDL